ncbi:MAG: fructosamine kinase family protein [Verrucomicrobiota bacterium]
MPWEEIESEISHNICERFTINNKQSIAGGCINEAYIISSESGKSFFTKLNKTSLLSMFEAEFDALKIIDETKTIRVPKPVAVGNSENKSFIVLEYIRMGSNTSPECQKLMGQRLALMHKQTGKQFGWFCNNTIGSTPQINTPCSDWIEFYTRDRLAFQFSLAREKGLRIDGEEKLYDKISDFFEDYDPEPSLLHGDLWSGNASSDEKGEPVIYDPATYYGDRETDLAFTEMFGGFTQDFYQAYTSEYPIDPGFNIRKELYNLYHVLNHYNLFGGGYGTQASNMVNHLLNS